MICSLSPTEPSLDRVDLFQDMPEQERIDFLSVYDQDIVEKMIHQRIAEGGSIMTARNEVHAATIALFRKSGGGCP